MQKSFLERAVQDIRFGWYTLRCSRTYTVAVVATLALAMSANTTILSVVGQVLARPLPYREPERLFLVAEGDGSGNYRAASYQTFLDWQRQSRALAGLAFVRGKSALLQRQSESERVVFAAVSPGFFSILGARVIVGRTFTADEDRGLAGPVMVLSYEFWQSRFGGDRSVVGTTIDYDDASARIVGILAPGVGSFYPQVSLWRPLAGDLARDPALANRNLHVDSRIIARLAPEVSIETARAEFRVIQRRLAAAYPSESSGWTTGEFFTVRDFVVADISTVLLLIGAGALVVLLIACVNVSNLSLVRAISRDREFAIRQALGAPRGRLAQQLLTESALIVLMAGAIGLLTAAWAIAAIRANAPTGLPRTSELTIGGQTVALAAALTLFTTLVVSVAPLLRLRSFKAENPLRQGRPDTSNRADTHLRGILSVAQLGLAISLLLCGGLLLRSLRRIQEVDLGYEPSRIVAGMLIPPSQKYHDAADAAATFTRLLRAVQAVPGVTSAALINHLPGTSGVPTQIVVPGRGDATRGLDVASYRSVSASYFRTMRIALLHGREFTDDDIRSPGDGIVISESVAERYWPGRDPTGEPITIFGANQARADYGLPQPSHVIGVVADVRVLGPSGIESHADVYVPFSRAPWPGTGIVARTVAAPASILPAVRKAILAIRPDIPIGPIGSAGGIRLLNDDLSRSLSTRRFTTALLGGFAGSAFLLALIGVYGVVAYGVVRRTRELGVRLALGAESRHVFMLILKRGLSVSLLGVTFGLVGGLAASRLFATMLYGISSADPVTFIVVPVAVVFTVVLACAMPALRAARLDPVVALRSD